jgi:hypothetical protein
MKTLLRILVCAVPSFSHDVWAAEDPINRLRACANLEPVARVKCVDQVLQELTKPAPSSRTRDQGWFVSETTSPVDYSPQLTAAIMADTFSEGGLSSLMIRCRGGRTEVIGTFKERRPPFSASAFRIAYQVNGGPVRQIQATSPDGHALKLQGDVISLIKSWPDDARLAIQIADLSDDNKEAVFHLGDFSSVKRRVSSACRW